MSKEYDGKFEDIIIGIPSNAVELNIEVTIYEDGKLEKVNGKYNLNDIEEAKKTFEKCCYGEYPTYIITDKGKAWLEELKRNGEI